MWSSDVTRFETSNKKIIDYCLVYDIKTAKLMLEYAKKYCNKKAYKLEITTFTDLENIIHDVEKK